MIKEGIMNKKNQEDLTLRRAWKNYGVGNFYKARALARQILASSESVASSREQAASIITMCSADPWAVASGLVVLLFILSVAYVVAF